MSHNQKYTDYELLDMLRECRDKHGRVTTDIFDEDEDFASASTVRERFGSWERAKEMAGVADKTPTSRQKYSDDDLIDQLHRVRDEEGVVTPKLFREADDTASVSTVVNRFGSWGEAKEAAGIDEDLSDRTGRERQVTDEQILSDLRELADRHDSVTTENLAKEDDLVSASVATERFGSWKTAKEKAGLEPDERSKNSRPRQYTREDYLQMLRDCMEKHGKVTQRQFDDDDEFASSAAIRKEFGSWSEGKMEAGIDDESNEYTDEELLDLLKECRRKHGKCTARLFASDDDFPAPETVQRHFGKWSIAKREAFGTG